MSVLDKVVSIFTTPNNGQVYIYWITDFQIYCRYLIPTAPDITTIKTKSANHSHVQLSTWTSRVHIGSTVHFPTGTSSEPTVTISRWPWIAFAVFDQFTNSFTILRRNLTVWNRIRSRLIYLRRTGYWVADVTRVAIRSIIITVCSTKNTLTVRNFQ